MMPAEELAATADKLAQIAEADARRFWERVALPDSSGCMLWLAGRQSKGYGVLRMHGTMKSAHRISLFLSVGGPPAGRPHAAHACLNKHCVAPTHLRWASTRENERDKVRDGTAAVGERHGAAKLTRSQVQEIKAQYASGGVTQAVVASRFGVSEATVWRILHDQRWGEDPRRANGSQS